MTCAILVWLSPKQGSEDRLPTARPRIAKHAKARACLRRMGLPDHGTEIEVRQDAIYRAMTPAQRLEQALRMNRQMRSLMDAALRAEHPDWTPEQRQGVIARRILHARTG